MTTETTEQRPLDTITYSVTLPLAIQPFLDKLRDARKRYTDKPASDAELIGVLVIESALQDAGYTLLIPKSEEATT